MNSYKEIKPVFAPVASSIRPPGSKSLTNRALPIAAMASGRSVLDGVLDSDDTRVMIESLNRVGVSVSRAASSSRAVIEGVGGSIPTQKADLFIGNSGTTIRFLTAVLAVAGGDYVLDGVPRMRQRPIGPLVDALQMLHLNVEAGSPGGCPPVRISTQRSQGGTVKIKGNLSSQYLSGLMMAAPLAAQDTVIEIDGALISRPYVEMTKRVMESFGVAVDVDQQFGRFEIGGGQAYQATDYQIEPDASSASYFWAVAAICGGSATVLGLDAGSLQGDVGFVNCLEQMGCDVEWGQGQVTVRGPAKHGIDIDMSNVSDTVQTLAAVALFVEGPTNVRNIAHNRVKETDRIGNLAIELRKLGATVEEREDGLTIHPGATRPAEIETYDDHRMAMSLALAGLRQAGVKILDPECVSKTYPNFFEDLEGFLRN
ncbi:MAG: 3-phosphoshikimate 1-carboxyvinyltransferase [Planctomycetaceae bacterium]|nr:3-phosphoshikimate 1-carboxyvinyltransferase [Planctomycetaceae bacterium]MCP4477580.1 3-phosphoshikimate 1-carboxyvinyltransferase [Planctomycetaceae bacterium]MCP4773917.1 3-phosphoshikimate 1-carboxyvinyltransferase [Planctomycetaceae bacterium]